MVTHRNTDVKVLHGRSSNPTSSHLFFWQIKVIYSHRYITLGWQSEANNWREFESEIHDFFLYWRTDVIYHSGVVKALKKYLIKVKN